MSLLFVHVIQHVAVNHSINEWFSSLCWTAAYSLCLRAGWVVMNASFEISGPFTTMLSALMSYNRSSPVGTLSLGFYLNHCTRSINSDAVYGRTVTWSVLWAGGHWSGGTPLAYPVFFFFFWVTTGWISKGSSPNGASRSNLLVLSFTKSSLCGFSCTGSLVISREIFRIFCTGMMGLGFSLSKQWPGFPVLQHGHTIVDFHQWEPLQLCLASSRPSAVATTPWRQLTVILK